jgi:hypothetical protein
VDAGAGQAGVSWPFAAAPGSTVYLPVLAFDNNGGTHIAWNWRPEQAGEDTYEPSYAYQSPAQAGKGSVQAADGTQLSLPVGMSDVLSVPGFAPGTSFYAAKSLAVAANGDVLLVVHSVKGGRMLLRLDRKKGIWSVPVATPAGASQIVVDRQGREWMFATGLRIFMRPAGGSRWNELESVGKKLCSPVVSYSSPEDAFYVRVKDCNEAAALIYRISTG